MKIQYLSTGREHTVTKEQWAKIVENGWASLYKILESPPTPKEVEEHIEKAKGKN